jgi:hypothetical protein
MYYWQDFGTDNNQVSSFGGLAVFVYILFRSCGGKIEIVFRLRPSLHARLVARDPNLPTEVVSPTLPLVVHCFIKMALSSQAVSIAPGGVRWRTCSLIRSLSKSAFPTPSKYCTPSQKVQASRLLHSRENPGEYCTLPQTIQASRFL